MKKNHLLLLENFKNTESAQLRFKQAIRLCWFDWQIMNSDICTESWALAVFFGFKKYKVPIYFKRITCILFLCQSHLKGLLPPVKLFLIKNAKNIMFHWWKNFTKTPSAQLCWFSEMKRLTPDIFVSTSSILALEPILKAETEKCVEK